MAKSRAVPQSEEAETGIIGSLLLQPMLFETFHAAGLTAEHFENETRRLIFASISEMYATDTTIDLISLTQYMRDKDRLVRLAMEIQEGPDRRVEKGAALLTHFVTYPCISQTAHHIEILDAKLMFRRALKEGNALVEGCYEKQDQEPREIVLACIERLESCLRPTGQKMQCVTTQAITNIKNRAVTRAMFGDDSIKTGIEKWDKVTGGVNGGKMIVIGSRPKVGKSALAEIIMASVMKQNAAVINFQRDMRVEDQVARMACREAGLIFEDWNNNAFDGEEMDAFNQALDAIDTNLLRIHSPQNLTTRDMRSIVKSELRTRDVKAVFLDVFIRLSVTHGDYVQGLARASNDLRDMCHDFDIAFYILAHLNKSGKNGEAPKPSEFKYCDQLFADCDMAALMWTDEEPEEGKRQEVQVKLAGNRGGNTGSIKLYFDRPHMTFHPERRPCAGSAGSR